MTIGTLFDLIIVTVSQSNTELIALMLFGKRDFFSPLSMPVPNGINKKQRRQESQHRTNTTSLPEPGFEPGTSRTTVEHLPAALRRSAYLYYLQFHYFEGLVGHPV